MPEFILNVPMKGSRDYLQSANIWDSSRPLLLAMGWRPEARLSLTFRQLMARAPVLRFPADRRPAQGVAAGDVVLSDGDRRETGFLLIGDREVSSRIKDYEDTIRPGVTTGSEGARFVGAPSSMSAIEVVVAVTKFLHQDTVSRDIKWLATRLDLPLGFELSQTSRLEIKIARRTDMLATLSDVLVDDVGFGRIAFNPLVRAKS